jgi:hypothetical protein
MPSSVHIPVLGNVPKGALFAGGLAAVGVTGYLLYRKSKKGTTASSTSYGYGASGYGYGTQSGYYGYGSEFGYGVTPYPVGSEYGYGAYGYGYYNPYTGQYLGGGTGTPPTTGPGTGGGTGGGTGTGTTGGGTGQKPTHTEVANGSMTFQKIAAQNKVTMLELITWNPQLMPYLRSKKPLPRGTKVKV